MQFVTVHEIRRGQDTVPGHILWDGVQLQADPPNDPVLLGMIQDVQSSPTPLEDLHQMYRSSYLHTTPPMNIQPTQFRNSVQPTRYETPYNITQSQGDGWKITTPHGHIDYRPTGDGANEIWWIESHKKDHGSELMNLMLQSHPADAIHWGVTTPDGKRFRDKWHKTNPGFDQGNGAFEGQYDPSGDNYGENAGDEDEDYDEDPE